MVDEQNTSESEDEERREKILIENWLETNIVPNKVMTDNIMEMLERWQSYCIPPQLVYIGLKVMLATAAQCIGDQLSPEERKEAEEMIPKLIKNGTEREERDRERMPRIIGAMTGDMGDNVPPQVKAMVDAMLRAALDMRDPKRRN